MLAQKSTIICPQFVRKYAVTQLHKNEFNSLHLCVREGQQGLSVTQNVWVI